MIDRKALLNDLKQQVKAVEADLGKQVKALDEVGARLRAEYDQARKLGRTAATWNSWLDERVTQVAVAWVLGTVFVRFCAAGLGAGTGLGVAVVYGVLSLVASLPGVVVLVGRRYAARYPRSPSEPSEASESSEPSDVDGVPAVSAVSSATYSPKESARLSSSSFPFSADPSEGRPMTPESV